jgi:hypothetical protein
VWGIQFERYGWNQQELSQFAFTPKNESGGVQRFGHLVGLGELPTPSRVEVSPYVSSRAEYTNVPQGNPFRSGHDYFASGGGDLRLRVSSNLSLNATLNPDFGQVEVDPAVVNLTAFETFFPEKRPFFVEGQELFQYGQLRTFNSSTFPTLFFSRRIGRAPQRDLDTTSFHYATSPPQSTIATAAKLTGKTSSGWSLGLMEAATLEEQADFRDNLSLSQRTPVEPFTNYVVGRVRREMNLGASQAGIFFSAVNRDLSDPNLRDMLRSGAYVAGADLNHSWANRSWALDASFARSQIQGNTAAILDAQNSSRRYYGRPDATSFHLDSTRTALTGFAGQVALTRTSATHWVGNLAYQVVSPGFEVNDVGFQTAADRHAVSSDLTYRDNTPHKILRTFRYDVFTNQGWNFDGNNVNNNFATSSFGIFRNFSGYFVRADFNPETTDDRLTRGGPLARLPRGWSTWWEYFSDPRKVYTADAHVFYVSDRGLNHRTELGVIFRLQPNPTLILSFEPLYTTTHHSAQYLDTESDPLATSTYGSRYIFGTLDQKELSLVTRLSLTFTPKLSLQVYAQPLVSAGNYTSFSQLRAPRTYAFDVYGRDVGSVTRANQQVTIDPDGNPGTANSFTLDEPNFNFRSLRGNAVLRWEYRPGSTIFLVWQQSRSDTQVLGDFRFGRDFSGLFDTKPENVFAVKMTYWLAR